MRLSSLTAVVASDGDLDPLAVKAISEATGRLAVDSDIIIVTAQTRRDDVRNVSDLVEQTPDCSALFLSHATSHRTLWLSGLDNSVGDFVFLCRGLASDANTLVALAAAAHDGADLVVATDSNARTQSLYGQARILFARLLRSLSGLELAAHGDHARLLSRAAVLYVTDHAAAELIVEARSIGQGFAAETLNVEAARAHRRHDRGLVGGTASAVSTILSVTAAPLRLASLLSLLLGVISIVYAVYVLLTFILLPNVQRGWASLSLQVGVLTFFMSIVLFLISEYVIQIYRVASSRVRRSPPVREVRSALSRKASRLNIIDSQGRYSFGAPASGVDPEEEAAAGKPAVIR